MHAEHFNLIETLNRMWDQFSREKDRRNLVHIALSAYTLAKGVLHRDSANQCDSLFGKLMERSDYRDAYRMMAAISADRNISKYQRLLLGDRPVPVVMMK